ncbi:unnamed protein product, partial [Prunus brigantina]
RFHLPLNFFSPSQTLALISISNSIFSVPLKLSP